MSHPSQASHRPGRHLFDDAKVVRLFETIKAINESAVA
jgi:hypothetical protein